MLSYRHSFHVGNHGDVLKHWSLVTMLEHLNQKEKPYWYIDTHSGAARYDLRSQQSRMHKEHEGGWLRLLQQPALPESLARYVDLELAEQSKEAPDYYLGSPAIAQAMMRPQDKLWLYELHPSDAKQLRRFSQGDPRIQVQAEDGYQGLKSLLPPPTKRALILLDPSYEVKTEYHHVIKTLEDSLQRFAIGVYMIWYPLLNQIDNVNFRKRLAKFSQAKWLNLTLTVENQKTATGMYGSGVFIINPPWLTQEAAPTVLPFLADSLGKPNEGNYEITDSGDL